MKSVSHIRRVYYLIIFLFWLATALPMTLSILLAQARGLNLFQVGLLMGGYALTIVLLEVPTGGLADALGRKRVSLLAYGCAMVAEAVMLGAFSFPVFMVAFVLSGVGRALSSGALEAWFIDALQAIDPETDLQPALAGAGAISLLALGLGALGGSFIPQFFSHLPAEGTAVFTPFSTPILFSLAVWLLLLASTTGLVKESRPGATRDWRQGFRDAPVIIRTGINLSRRNPTIVLLLGTTFAGGLAIIGLESFWQPHFAALLGGSQGNSPLFGLVLGGNFLVGMGGNLLSTPLSRLLHKRYGLVCAIFQGLSGASILLLALQTGAPGAVVFFWLTYLNMGVVNSPHSALLNQEIPAEQRSAMLSIASLAGYAGAMVGGAGLGVVAQYGSINAAWGIGGLVLVVSLGLYWRIDARRRREMGSIFKIEPIQS